MHKNILSAVGNTPIVQVQFKTPARIFAKLEYFNPGGSVKDRSALYMVEQAEKTDLLQSGGTIIDASSGNHGIATAMIGAAKGYNVIIVVSEKVSNEKRAALEAYGAKIVICPATNFIEDPQSYHNVARKLHKETPNSFMPNQYFNQTNAEGHYKSLGPEIWSQTDGKITHFFAAVGTGGTISGAGKYLKEQNPTIKVIALDSINSFRSTGGKPKPYCIEGMGIDFDTPVVNYDVIDEIIPIADNDALHMIKHLAHTHGILVGPSSGAVAHGVKTYLHNLKQNDLVVMIFGDSGRAYLSKGFYKQ